MQRIFANFYKTLKRFPLAKKIKVAWSAWLLNGVILAFVLHSFLMGIAPAALTQAVPTQRLENPVLVAKTKSNWQENLLPFDSAIEGTEKLEGLFPLYRHPETGAIYAEITPAQLDTNFLCTITIESGIGERGLYSGMPLEDFLFYFHRVNDKVQFVVRNVNFRTDPDDPQIRSLKRSFSDSVLYALPIQSIHPERESILIDLGEMLLTDFPGISSFLQWALGSPYAIDAEKSYFGEATAFPLNVEIESIYTFAAAGEQQANILTLPDTRAFTLRMHYSFSKLEENNSYRPRIADDRVGYFITVYQDFSNDNRKEPFVRYINRWHLEKENPSALLSPPKKPITFWIDNAVPVEYRDAIRQGVLMWNKAFEKAGFLNAIEVQQMPDDADWDPADVRYNTIRWFNSLDGYFAMGPSRVNPLTGEILDADIIVDSNFVRVIKREYSTLVEQQQSGDPSLFNQNVASCADEWIDRYLHPTEAATTKPAFSQMLQRHDLCFGMQAADQLSVGAISMSLIDGIEPDTPEMKAYVEQFLQSLIAHEVGHTLGLRHNFHGSTMLMPEELHKTEVTRTRGLVASVMDYTPVNLSPIGVPQGDYYPVVVGPYDEWAIQYGYKPLSGIKPEQELPYLKKIAQRSAHPDLSYATDEDIWADDIDPYAHPFDLSEDVLLHSQLQMDNARDMWTKLERRYLPKGESYNELRVLFDTIFGYYFRQAYFVTQFVGGQSFHRNHIGDPNGRPPFIAVPAAKQRQALATLQTYIFNDQAFQFSPELLNNLAPSRWAHWGNDVPMERLDYPIYEQISFLQRVVLRALMYPQRLARLRDAELKAQPGQALMLPELFDTLHQGIWTEVMVSGPSASISTLRRALQREYLEILTQMVLGQSNAPDDARTLARYKLRQLREDIGVRLANANQLDTYTQAHLEETQDRLVQVLDAQLVGQ
jgi:predicted Zn-dependent protease